MENLIKKALAFRKTKLWKKVNDDELIAVEHTDGIIGYCSITGMSGEGIDLTDYYGTKGLDSLRKLRDCDEEFRPELFENFITQDCVSCSFVTLPELRPGEYQMIREYCDKIHITLRGPIAYPQFSRYRPYHWPQLPQDETDKNHMEEALDVCLDLSDKLAGEWKDFSFAGLSGLTPGQEVLLAKFAPDRSIIWSRTTLPDCFSDSNPGEIEYSEFLARRVKESKKKSTKWMCDILALPSVVSSDPELSDPQKVSEDKLYFPLFSIAVDEEGRILFCDFNPDESDYKSFFVDLALQNMNEWGVPSDILVTNDRAYHLYAGISKYLGIHLSLVSRCNELAEAEEDLYRSMTSED